MYMRTHSSVVFIRRYLLRHGPLGSEFVYSKAFVKLGSLTRAGMFLLIGRRKMLLKFDQKRGLC